MSSIFEQGGDQREDRSSRLLPAPFLPDRNSGNKESSIIKSRILLSLLWFLSEEIIFHIPFYQIGRMGKGNDAMYNFVNMSVKYNLIAEP